MEIRQLEYFRTIAAFLNLTKAAEALHITQPALSRILKRLEEDIGFELFVRRSSHLELSSAGEIFLKAVNTALDTLNESIRECEKLVGEEDRQLSVSVAYEGLNSVPTELFLRCNPTLNVKQMLLPIDTMQNRLISHELDIAIAPNLFSAPEIQWRKLMTEEMLLIFPLGHPMEGRLSINLEEFKGLSLAFNEAVYDRTSYNRICAEHSLKPNIVFQSNEHQMISNYMNMSRENCALFVPASSFREMMKERKLGLNTEKPLPARLDPPVFFRTLGVAWHGTSGISRIAQKYIELITDYFSKLESELSNLVERTFSRAAEKH